MNASIRLGRVWGIPIGLHYSWFIVFVLVTVSLAAGTLATRLPSVGVVVTVALAAITSLLFFVSVLAHELGHALVAQRDGVPVRAINLFVFGGVAQISREPDTPVSELRIAIAGPLMSIGIGVVVGALAWTTRDIALVSVPAAWLAQINIALAIFNMLPAFPLDGGRVLRAVVWRATGSMRRATRFASASGQVFAFGFIGLGVLSVVGGELASGLWLVFIGWFLNGAASSSSAQITLRSRLRRVPVASLMTRNLLAIASDTHLDVLIDSRVVGMGQRCFYVTREGRVVGMLTLTELSGVPRQSWPTRTADEVMVPRERLDVVAPRDSLETAAQSLDDSSADYLPVVDDGMLVGTLSRSQVQQYVQARKKVGA